MNTNRWFAISNPGDVPSPALVIHKARVEENILQMVKICGSTARLRPHVKTHKMAELIRLQQAQGIHKFKCATIAEAELVAGCGVRDILVAYPLVGPSIARFIALQRAHPAVQFSSLTDDPNTAKTVSAEAVRSGQILNLFVDLDIGQHRTGVAPDQAFNLCRELANLPGVRFAGLHAYDGHIHHTDPAERARECEAAFAPVVQLRSRLEAAKLAPPRIIAGGTPTFPMHAARGDVECSPGTCVFWDAGYSAKLPDLRFQIAAVLLCRVISKPDSNRVCLDLGHKAVASEMPHPRVIFPEIPDALPVGHNEEHLVISTASAANLMVGDVVYALPWHICPTVALHSEAWVAQNGQATVTWQVPARARRMSY